MQDTKKSLQILLWLWFGIMTSFVSVNVVNIKKLETQNQQLEKDVLIYKTHHINCPHFR
jgi:hypothetical protein